MGVIRYRVEKNFIFSPTDEWPHKVSKSSNTEYNQIYVWCYI